MFRVATAKNYLLFSGITLVAVDDMKGVTGRLGKTGFRKYEYVVKHGDNLSFLAPFWRQLRVGDMLDERDVMLMSAAGKFIPAFDRRNQLG